MTFRTVIKIPPGEPKIAPDSAILLLGSCFVENIGKKLEYHKFRTLQNPFGILFHPTAIATFLSHVSSLKRFSEADIFPYNERWHSFDAHSALSSPDKMELLQKLNSAVQQTHEFLQKASHVVITPGTAWGYRHKASDRTVANCHKLPQREFTKELTKVEAQMAVCVDIIRNVNPEATVIFTVSPVRHLKDGFVENQQSKSRLITAVHDAIAHKSNTHYFPSYELMMDELRDYRFYAEDMLHPNATAIDYIWTRFCEAWMSEASLQLLEAVKQIQLGLAHRPFNKDSEAHKKFVDKLQQQIRRLQDEYPHLSF